MKKKIYMFVALSILGTSFNWLNISNEEITHSEATQKLKVNSFINECKTTYYSTVSSNDRCVSENDLRENKITEFSSCKDLSTGHIKSDEWRGSNAIGRYMDIYISRIFKVNGIYSHYSSYFDHDILESGSASTYIDTSETFTDTKSQSLAFDFSVNYYVEAKLESYTEIDVVSQNTSIKEKAGASYVYDCTHTRNVITETKWSSHFSISKETAKYCPDGYSISIGKEGTYYYIVGSYQEMSMWWWGNYKTQGTKEQYFTCVLANPNNFNYCFAYKNKLNTDKDYFKL